MERIELNEDVAGSAIVVMSSAPDETPMFRQRIPAPT
jgi:hypothetical protein